MENTIVQHPSSNFPGGDMEPVRKEYGMLSTGTLIFSLIIIFFILKSFIYIPDEKRKGK